MLMEFRCVIGQIGLYFECEQVAVEGFVEFSFRLERTAACQYQVG